MLPPITWNGVTVTTADNNEQWFNITRYIGGGDVLRLMEDMHSEIVP